MPETLSHKVVGVSVRNYAGLTQRVREVRPLKHIERAVMHHTLLT